MSYRDEMIYDWYIKYPLANEMIPIDIVRDFVIRLEENLRDELGEIVNQSTRRMPRSMQESRLELDKLQVEIRENAIASGADMGQVREMFMLQWEEFAGYRI